MNDTTTYTVDKSPLLIKPDGVSNQAHTLPNRQVKFLTKLILVENHL